MIPLRLTVKNFMCYGEDANPLVLEGVRVACLSGDNGHGKSALLDAMTWALWGRGRAKSDDELVHVGKTEMEVEFEFAVGATRYRVIRKRLLKGKRGLPSLEFQLHGKGGYRPITGNSIHETQRKIVETLRMEYETFINSALLLQGRADEFTLKPAAERKKVLADVLGLARYDELEGLARERARAADQARRELANDLEEIGRELEHWPEYEALRGRVAEELAAVERDLGLQQVVLRRALEAKQELDAKSLRVAELRQRLGREQRQAQALEAQVTADRRDLLANEALLSERKGIEDGYRRLVAAREQTEALARQANQLLDLNQRKGALEKAIARQRHELEAELHAQATLLAGLETKAGQGPSIDRELAALRLKLDAIDGLEARRDALRDTAQSSHSQIAGLKTANDRLKQEMALLKEKIDLLGGPGASCPLCQTELGPAGRQTLAEAYKTEGTRLADEYRAQAALAKTLEGQAAQAQRDLVNVEDQLSQRGRLRQQAGALERGLAEVAEATSQAIEAGERVGKLRARLAQGDFGRAEQAQLQVVEREITALSYDSAAHERLRREIASLRAFEGRLAELQAAQAAVALLRDKVHQNAELLARQGRAVADIEGDLASLAAEVARGSSVLADLAVAEDRVDQLGRTAADLHTKLGRAQQLLSHCEYLDKQRKEKTLARQRAAEEKSIYDDLALAFGKKGIQAMIIDSAIPEIEEEANALLARLTDNRMHVKLETQREAKSSDGIIETLDIKIADELGYRQYELYSGGEAFRVNFAIRIAISKLLARRAGARLQTLIIDEGFGTQDAAGRERLVEAITSVSDDFECIVAITHIQELKDAFPVRIEVTKGAEGSQIVITE